MDSAEAARQANCTRRWIILAAIVVCYAIFNLTVDDYGLDGWAARLVVGVQIALPILLAAWAVFGPPPAIKRVPLTVAALIFITMASCIRMHARNIGLLYLEIGLPYLEILLISLALFLGSAILLQIVRLFLPWSLVDQSAISENAPSQYSLKYLIGLTAIIALLLAGGRILLLADDSVIDLPLSDFAREVAGPIGVMLLAMLPPVIATLLVLSPRPGLRVVGTLVIVWLVMSLGAIQLMLTIDPGSWLETAQDVFGFQIGATLAGVVTALLLRVAGYRVLARRRRAAET